MSNDPNRLDCSHCRGTSVRSAAPAAEAEDWHAERVELREKLAEREAEFIEVTRRYHGQVEDLKKSNQQLAGARDRFQAEAERLVTRLAVVVEAERLAAKLAASSDYAADHDPYPTFIQFENGRTVEARTTADGAAYLAVGVRPKQVRPELAPPRA